jgi:hypothetical protein
VSARAKEKDAQGNRELFATDKRAYRTVGKQMQRPIRPRLRYRRAQQLDLMAAGCSLAPAQMAIHDLRRCRRRRVEKPFIYAAPDTEWKDVYSKPLEPHD